MLYSNVAIIVDALSKATFNFQFKLFENMKG